MGSASAGSRDEITGSGNPDLLASAAALRWVRPDLTAALADHVLECASVAGERDLWLAAAGWALHARLAIGDGRETASDIIEALPRWGAAPLAGPPAQRLRVELALVAGRAGERDAARALVAPVTADPAVPALQAEAFCVLARCAVDDAPEEVAAALHSAESAWSRVEPPHGDIGAASVAIVRAAAKRQAGQPDDAVGHAAEGLARLERGRGSGSSGTPSAHLAAALAAEWIAALLDAARVDEAREGCVPLMPRLAEPNRPSRHLARLRLTVARTVATGDATTSTVEALEKATRDAVDSDVPDLEVVCRSTLAAVHEKAGRQGAALEEMRLSGAAERRDADRTRRLRAALATLPLEKPPATEAAPGARRNGAVHLSPATSENERSAPQRDAGQVPPSSDRRSATAAEYRPVGGRRDRRRAKDLAERAEGEAPRNGSRRSGDGPPAGSGDDTAANGRRRAGHRSTDATPDPLNNDSAGGWAIRWDDLTGESPIGDLLERSLRSGGDEIPHGDHPLRTLLGADRPANHGHRGDEQPDADGGGRSVGRSSVGGGSLGGDRSAGDRNGSSGGSRLDRGRLGGDGGADTLAGTSSTGTSFSGNRDGEAIDGERGPRTRGRGGSSAADGGSGSDGSGQGSRRAEGTRTPPVEEEPTPEPRSARQPQPVPEQPSVPEQQRRDERDARGGRSSRAGASDVRVNRGPSEPAQNGRRKHRLDDPWATGQWSVVPPAGDPDEESAPARSGAGASVGQTAPGPTVSSVSDADAWLRAALADLERVRARSEPTDALPERAGIDAESCAVRIDIVRDGRRFAGRRAATVVRALADRLADRLPSGARLRSDEPDGLSVVLPGWQRTDAADWMHRTMPGLLDDFVPDGEMPGTHLRAAVHDAEGPIGAQILQRLDNTRHRDMTDDTRTTNGSASGGGPAPGGNGSAPRDLWGDLTAAARAARKASEVAPTEGSGRRRARDDAESTTPDGSRNGDPESGTGREAARDTGRDDESARGSVRDATGSSHSSPTGQEWWWAAAPAPDRPSERAASVQGTAGTTASAVGGTAREAASAPGGTGEGAAAAPGGTAREAASVPDRTARAAASAQDGPVRGGAPAVGGTVDGTSPEAGSTVGVGRHDAAGRTPFRFDGAPLGAGNGGRRHRRGMESRSQQPDPPRAQESTEGLGIADLLAGALAAYRGI